VKWQARQQNPFQRSSLHTSKKHEYEKVKEEHL